MPDSRLPFQVAQNTVTPSPDAVTPSPSPAVSPSPTPAPTASPTPTPTPTPSPTPTPTVTQQVVVPVRGVAEDIIELPGVRDLPFRGLLLTGIELFLITLFWIGLRRIIRKLVIQTTESLARREETSGNEGRAVRLRTLGGLTNALLIWTVSFVFLVTALSTLGVNVAGIIGTASIAGLAFGFGAQKLAKDVITGFFILLEDQYVIGDYVTIGTVTGTVEELGMRITRIRDDEGKLYILSNGDIAQVCNHSRGPVTGNFEISIAASVDPETASKTLSTALEQEATQLELPEKPRVEGITAADATKTTLRISFKVAPGHRPGPLLPHLREAARRALIAAEIPLA